MADLRKAEQALLNALDSKEMLARDVDNIVYIYKVPEGDGAVRVILMLACIEADIKNAISLLR